jgi:hypothetical protein
MPRASCLAFCCFLVVTADPGIAYAFPDGAPWGAANAAASQNCSTCHFDREAIHNSRDLTLLGVPQKVLPRATYELTLALKAEFSVAGFQILARTGEQPAGTFVGSASGIEAVAAGVRSTLPLPAADGTAWALRWQAPANINQSVVFYVAACAANADASPFGDTIHFRVYEVKFEPR